MQPLGLGSSEGWPTSGGRQDADRPDSATDPARSTLSIAMATFNGAPFLAQTLESLVRQSELPLELVICDDGSVDDTVAIAERFAADSPFPVHIHRNPSRLGHAGNFLCAASLCRGDLIAFSDQDDVWMPGKVRTCVDLLSPPDSASLLVHSAELVDADLRPLGRVWPRLENGRQDPASARPLNFYFGCLCCFDRQLLDLVPERLRPRLEDYESGHDEWIAFLAPLGRGVAFAREPLIRYRQHPDNQFGAPSSSQTAAIHGDIDPDLVDRRAATAEIWAAVLTEGVREGVIRADPAAVARWSNAHTRMARSLRRRAQFYRSDAWLPRRSLRWAQFVASGAYFDAPMGGLGGRALAKDVTVALLGPRGARRALQLWRLRSR